MRNYHESTRKQFVDGTDDALRRLALIRATGEAILDKARVVSETVEEQFRQLTGHELTVSNGSSSIPR
jgi:hypothetical protein